MSEIADLPDAVKVACWALLRATHERAVHQAILDSNWRHAIREALRAGIGATEVAQLAGISRERVYQIRNMNPQAEQVAAGIPASTLRSRLAHLNGEVRTPRTPTHQED